MTSKKSALPELAVIVQEVALLKADGRLQLVIQHVDLAFRDGNDVCGRASQTPRSDQAEYRPGGLCPEGGDSRQCRRHGHPNLEEP